MVNADIRKQALTMFRANKSNQEVREFLQLTGAEINYLRKEFQKPLNKRKL